MDMDEWSILSDNEIDYSSLTDEVLEKLTFGDDMFVATSALSELSVRQSKSAGILAWKILDISFGDKYLQACALEKLFQADPIKAKNYIKTNMKSCDPYILNSILELMNDNSEYFQPEINIVRTIIDIVQNLPDKEKYPTQEERDNFLKTFLK